MRLRPRISELYNTNELNFSLAAYHRSLWHIPRSPGAWRWPQPYLFLFPSQSITNDLLERQKNQLISASSTYYIIAKQLPLDDAPRPRPSALWHLHPSSAFLLRMNWERMRGVSSWELPADAANLLANKILPDAKDAKNRTGLKLALPEKNHVNS